MIDVKANQKATWTATPNQPTAWINDEGGVLFFASGEDQPFGSPIVRLVHGIHVLFGEESLRILRRRILMNCKIDRTSRGVVKILAKRISEIAADDNIIITCTRAIDVGLTPTVDNDSSRFIPGIVHSVETACVWVDGEAERMSTQFAGLNRHQRARAVAALLCDKFGNVLGAVVNSNATEKLRHAEINLLISIGDMKAADGMTLYISLKPCPMCAHFIAQWIGERSVRVIATTNDPGPCGRHHILDPWLEMK